MNASGRDMFDIYVSSHHVFNIMSIYALEVAIFFAMLLRRWSSKALPQKRAKCIRDMMMEPHMTESVFLCRLRLFGSKSM